jgi:hypothetical protein
MMAPVESHDTDRVRQAREVYRRLIDPKVEADNEDRFVVFDEATDDFEIGDDLIEIARRLMGRRPNARPFAFRIGGGGRAVDRFHSLRAGGSQ